MFRHAARTRLLAMSNSANFAFEVKEISLENVNRSANRDPRSRMRYVALPLVIALFLAATASAQTTGGGASSGQQISGTTSQPPQTASPQSTGNGQAVGQHVPDMAPEHPLEDGQHFGDCVSELAITGYCPHHELLL